MIKVLTGAALAALVSMSMAAPASAQERQMRRAVSGEPAMLNKAMTERQARRVCQTQLRGAKGSKSARNVQMKNCVMEQMQGN